MKECNKCGMVKGFTEFLRDRRKDESYIRCCRTCARIYQKQYWEAHKFEPRPPIIVKLLKLWCRINSGTTVSFTSFDEFANYVMYGLGIDTAEKLKGLHIHRVDSNGSYAPGNVIFMPARQHLLYHALLRRMKKGETKLFYVPYTPKTP